MSEEQGVEAEVEVPQDDNIVEEVDVKTEETGEELPPEVEDKQPEETVEQKVERLEREVQGKQKAIDRKTAALSSLNQKFEEERQESQKLLSNLKEQQPDKEPSIDDFDTHDDYVNALVDYKAKAKITEQQELVNRQQEQIRQETILKERVNLRQQQEAEFIADNPMYKASANEVDAYVKQLESTPQTQQAVLDQVYSGNVPQVIDYFGSNNGEHLEELGEISRMTPPQAAVAIYKIQQKLSVTPAKKVTKTSSEPIKAVKGNGLTRNKLVKNDDVLKQLGLK